MKAMKKSLKLLSILALLVVGALTVGCTGPDIVPPERHSGLDPEPPGTVTLTTTITMGVSAGTKALDAEGHKTFSTGDVIAVVYEKTSGSLVKVETDALTGTDITNGGKTAKITVTLTNPKAGGTLKYIYPAAMVKGDGTVNYAALDTQDGTLTTLASALDLAVYEGNLTDAAALPASASLTNPLCIGEFNIKDDSGNDITSGITMMTVFEGTNAYIVKRTSTAGPIYVAMQPVGDDKTLQFCATDGTTNYRRNVSGQALAAGNLYPVNLTMPTDSRTALELLTANFTAHGGETLTGVLLGKYTISIADTEDGQPVTVTLDGVDINCSFPKKANDSGIICNGNTILQLADGSNNEVKGVVGYAGVYIKNDRTLTIRGNGSLTATGTGNSSQSGAGIGGRWKYASGSIVIESGTIVARGAGGSAGIGNGTAYEGNGTIEGGDITITGGTVTATGGDGGAGIGTGSAQSRQANNDKNFGTVLNNHCGNILISGGTVEATGGYGAAGIGCGYVVENRRSKTKSAAEAISNQCGNISITADVTSVTATKGDDAPNSIGIGRIIISGSYSNVRQTCGTITFGDKSMYNGSAWTPTPTSGSDYGGLHFVISRTNKDDDTWTLTPATQTQ